MTPLEEAVARIIDPVAWFSKDSGMQPMNWLERRNSAFEKARRILALPEIVKMQEALEEVVAGYEDDRRSVDSFDWVEWYERASAALQPLKKEAE